MEYLPVTNNTQICLPVHPLYDIEAAPEMFKTTRKKPTYDEKTDIWKIPKICEHFLSFVKNNSNPVVLLDDIHKRCRQLDPDMRPTAFDVLKEYHKVMNIL
jgi:serine/threonine protein kinase